MFQRELNQWLGFFQKQALSLQALSNRQRQKSLNISESSISVAGLGVSVTESRPLTRASDRYGTKCELPGIVKLHVL